MEPVPDVGQAGMALGLLLPGCGHCPLPPWPSTLSLFSPKST